MDWKTYLLRFAGFIVITAGGWYLYSIVFHGMLYLGIMPTGDDAAGYGEILTARAVYAWMAAVPASFISIFIKGSWRYVLYFSPIYAPSLFALFFTLFQN